MKKVLSLLTLLLLPLAWGASLASVTLDKEFTVTIMDKNKEVCKVTFKVDNNQLTTSVNGNGTTNGTTNSTTNNTGNSNSTTNLQQQRCTIQGDVNTGFTVMLLPSTTTNGTTNDNQ